MWLSLGNRGQRTGGTLEYQSTRGIDKNVSSRAAILRGLCSDGGLFVPSHIPALEDGQWLDICDMDYAALCHFVLSRFLTDYPDDILRRCIAEAYQTGAFENNDPAPLVRRADGVYMLELWHGPTAAFKDLALQLMPRLFSEALRLEGSAAGRALVLVATSGDTGKAALEGFCDVQGTGIAVLFPNEGVSEIQRLQMVTQRGANIEVAALSGNFDDAQSAVKQIFSNEELSRQLADQGVFLSSANSINWGRLVPQIVYYFYACAQLFRAGALREGQCADFCVPTGNFGNILAAWYAKRMGAPLGRLICASNRNDVLTDFLQKGVYDRNRPFFATQSPSMDILVSSNLERLLYELSGRDGAQVAGWMAQLNADGRYDVGKDLRDTLVRDFCGGRCDDQQAAAEIARVFEETRYLLDPHTAVASAVARTAGCDGNRPLVVVSTASPFKFAPDVLRALNKEPDADCFAAIDQLAAQTDGMPPQSLAALQKMPVRHTRTLKKQQVDAWTLDTAKNLFPHRVSG